jgi:hypothetical protein
MRQLFVHANLYTSVWVRGSDAPPVGAPLC